MGKYTSKLNIYQGKKTGKPLAEEQRFDFQ